MRILPKLGGRLPGSVLAMLRIEPGEKVLAWGEASTADGTQSAVTAATDRALYVQATGERFAWERVLKATWEQPQLVLTVTDDPAAPPRIVTIELDEPRDLPAAVHDRVTASVVVSEHVDLGDGAGALMVARRGDDDAIRWSVVFDAGLDPADPALRRAADDALARLRDSLGI